MKGNLLQIHLPAGQDGWQRCVSVALASLGVFLPYGPAGVAFSLLGLVLLAVARPSAVFGERPWREPALATGLLLLAYIAVHTLIVSGFTRQAFGAVNRYHELLFAPLVFCFLRDPVQRAVLLRAMLVGGVLWAAAAWAGLVHPWLGHHVDDKRISAGFVLAALAWLALMLSRPMANPWPLRILAFVFGVTVLVPLGGRTGHVLVIVLVACAAWLKSPPKWRLPATLLVPVAVAAIALQSPGVQGRIQETLEGSRGWSANGPQTSTAIRIELARLSLDLARKHAWTGAGYANYSKENQAAAMARYGTDALRPEFRGPWFYAGNPHNEYANQLVGGGVIALALFLAWFVLILREARRMGGAAGYALGGITVAFMVGSLFNSWLMDFIEGHAFMAMLALLLAEGRFGGSAVAAREAGGT